MPARPPASSARPRSLRLRVRPRDWIRITREGWLFFAISLGVGVAAIRSGNNLLFLVLGMLLGMIIVSGILSEIALRGLVVRRVPPAEVQALKPFLMGISVTNLKRWFPSFSVEVEDIQSDRVLDKRCYFLKIPAGRTQSTSYRHAFARRGRYLFGGFKISTKFPFALLRKSRIVEWPGEVIVRPAVGPETLPDVPVPATAGPERRHLRGRGGDLYGLRPHRPGDDPREIHWRASAHRGRLLQREREAEAAEELGLVLDNQLVLHGEATFLGVVEGLERAITRTASLAAEALRRGYRVALVTRTGGIPHGEGPAHLSRVLEFLALLEYADPQVPLLVPRSWQGVLRVTPDGEVHRSTADGHGEALA
jgi:uncharacterized protein (DUF58 family)